MTNFYENSRRFYFRPIWSPFCPFEGKQDLFLKTHFFQFVFGYLLLCKILEKTDKKIPRKTVNGRTDAWMDSQA